MNNTILLVDGSSLLYRAFFAIPPLSYNGVALNAIHGFYSMLLSAIGEHKPSSVFVMFDESKPTFRHIDYAEYKAGRPPMPDDLRSQFTLIREFLAACGIPAISQPGFEADDLLGTAAKLAEKEGVQSIILTGDRDALQLATEHISILITKKGVSESLLLDPQGVKDSYGVYPAQVIDLKGLMGDKSDNIPGVPGVGEKTALKLLDEYGSIEQVLAHGEEIKGKLGEKIRENSQLALFSKKLATIVCNAPLEIDLYSNNVLGMQSGLPMLAKYRFNRISALIKALFEEGGAYAGKSKVAEPKVAIEVEIPTIQNNNEDAWHLVHKSLMQKQIAPLQFAEQTNTIICDTAEAIQALPLQDVHTLALFHTAQSIELYTNTGVLVQIPLLVDLLSQGLHAQTAFSALNTVLAGKQVLCHHQKELLQTWASVQFVPAFVVVWDSMIANYILEAAQGERSLEELTGEASAKALYSLATKQYTALNNAGMLHLALLCEFPLSQTLFAMEQSGFEIDRNILFDLSKWFSDEIERLQNLVYEQTGFDGFNLNSPKQLSEILFERMNLPHGKKNKSGYSTNAESLEKIAHLSPAIPNILEYRKFTKLKSTYIDALLALTQTTSRVHTRFDQTGTVTGRISSLDPNLQNIPIRSKEGAEIRKAFVAKDGYTLIDADYSQIELRVLAHLSGDENLIKAFQSGKDIHTTTAAEIFGIPVEKVDAAMRSNAKAVNFGLVYGISSFGLARNTNISLKEAEHFIAMYFDRYPGVRQYMDHCVEVAEKEGAIFTLFGRRRALPEMQSKNANMRAFGKRIAMNTPVQGTAADIIKLAMVRVQEELQNIENAKLILQVHDELIIECREDVAEQVSQMLQEVMQNVVSLKVPLVADIHTAKSWYESK
ncbi:MAG: DNA polymerase I [Eubacteriales bacterium]|nr:DNA polymerase I [Eubacteriales bacterium]